MTVTPVNEELRRLDDKSLDGQLLWELENGFELPPDITSIMCSRS